MSQKFHASDSMSDSCAGPSHQRGSAEDTGPPFSESSASAPHYLSTGNRSQSVHAAQLIAHLENDSGYGGSVLSGNDFPNSDASTWPELLHDHPMPAFRTGQDGEKISPSAPEKRLLASHVHQLHYNQNRAALARAIGHTLELLKGLKENNKQWPAHYPAAQRPSSSSSSRPALSHAASTSVHGDVPAQPQFASNIRPSVPRRAETSLGENSTAESSTAAARTSSAEPRLITPQVAQEFSILKLDLKLGALAQNELVHTLGQSSIASLLGDKIDQSERHLLSLRERIEDKSSKVLVTGDLNAGKSTFCNALLRRKLLPEDQQPCTGIFCEVLDARENGSVEEVHAVYRDRVYDRHDESTYDTYSLQELEKIVTDSDRYMQCKIYIKDSRTIDESLLHNGVVDIALIDAPGLNSDSVKTTAVFARQEEIDVVVFVVSAANHFTLSAKEFIWQAAHEKAYIFMVVNGFDNIRDKQRCQKQILAQIAKMSPRTFKEASELVHFVSSNAVPISPRPSPGAGRNKPDKAKSSGMGLGDDDSDDDDDDEEKTFPGISSSLTDEGDVPMGKDGEPGSPGKSKEKEKEKETEKEKIQDFDNLESALRRFVLEKRARSKLAPAKTYLLNCLGDIHVLAGVNRDVSQSELNRVTQELSAIEPAFETQKRNRMEVSEHVTREADETYDAIYDHTRSTLSSTIDQVGTASLGVPYPGLWFAFQYAEDLQTAMLERIAMSVTACEEYGRTRTVQGVSMISALGLLHVGDKYQNLSFDPDKMFKRRKDVLARAVEVEVDMLDFFDLGGLLEQQEKVVGTGMAMTVLASLGNRVFGGVGWLDGAFSAVRLVGSHHLRRMLVPGIIAAVSVATAYILSTIPRTLPLRLARKLADQLASLDYIHANSSRISSEVRKILHHFSQGLSRDLERGVERLEKQKADVSRIKHHSQLARKYFGNLVRESEETLRRVEDVDLEGPLPGGYSSYMDH